MITFGDPHDANPSKITESPVAILSATSAGCKRDFGGRELNKKPDYSYINRSIDTLCLAKAIKNEIKFNKQDNLFDWQYRLNNMYNRKSKKRLIDLCKHYDIQIDENKLHDAMYDIEQNYEVFIRN